MKILYAFILTLLFSLPQAYTQIRTTHQTGNLRVEPVVGYERAQKIFPEPRTKNRFYYGFRAHYGPSLLSIEAEVTQARDNESFPDRDLELKETSTTAMLGVRSNIINGALLNWYLRAGGHARRVDQTRIESGVSTTYDPAIRVSPYAGTGLVFKLGQYFHLNAGSTIVFTGYPDSRSREYRHSLGFTFRI